jgi:hypothetical protein
MSYKTQNLIRNNLTIIKKITTKKIDIFFHLGWDKCPYSTLQDVVFPLTSWYLGAKKNTYKTPLCKKF